MTTATKTPTDVAEARTRTARGNGQAQDRAGDPGAVSTFKGVERDSLPYRIEATVSGLDVGNEDELSEWVDEINSGSSAEQRAWNLASDAMRNGYRILVKVSPGNAFAVTALIASRMKEPVFAAYKSETQTLVFWSQTGGA